MKKVACMGTGSTDGLASQLLSKMNIILLSMQYGYQYVEIPFDDSYIKGNSGHRYGQFSTTLQNQAFDFSSFEKIHPLMFGYDKCKIINSSEGGRDYLLTQIESSSELIIANNFNNLFADDPKVYSLLNKVNIVNSKLLPALYSKKNRLKVAVHVRRGDIMLHEVNFNRIIDNRYFEVVVNRLIDILKILDLDYDLILHCEDDISLDFNSSYQKFVNENPIASFMDLVTADVIVSSKSSHSTVPSMLSGGVNIYPHDTWMVRCPGWIKADANGAFDSEQLRSRLTSYIYLD